MLDSVDVLQRAQKVLDRANAQLDKTDRNLRCSVMLSRFVIAPWLAVQGIVQWREGRAWIAALCGAVVVLAVAVSWHVTRLLRRPQP